MAQSKKIKSSHKQDQISPQSSAQTVQSTVDKRELARMVKIISILKREYPDVRCYLDHNTPFQLLVATILSAQCTDERVNQVTPKLFQKFPDAQAMAKATQKQIETLIQSTGFFRQKAKSIRETSQAIVKEYGGELPKTLDELTRLRGVGRKTANVLLGNAYGVPSFVVDTHVGRIVRRLGFTNETDPVKVEFAMMPIVPKEDWTMFSLWIIAHGRAVCTARKAMCDECSLKSFCPKLGVIER